MKNNHFVRQLLNNICLIFMFIIESSKIELYVSKTKERYKFNFSYR